MTARLQLYACEKCGAVVALTFYEGFAPGEHPCVAVYLDAAGRPYLCGGVRQPLTLGDFLTAVKAEERA